VICSAEVRLIQFILAKVHGCFFYHPKYFAN
jgi:hypothetical protein